MEAELGFAVGTALNALGLALGATSLAVSGVVYFLSRAGKIRAFESRVYSQLTNAASRIETTERQWAEEKLALNAIVDEVIAANERTTKERRRLYQEHRRDDNKQLLEQNNAPTDISLLPREEQLRHVRAYLQGG